MIIFFKWQDINAKVVLWCDHSVHAISLHLCYRVRTGYGILEKLLNFEKEVPWKNYGIFVLVEKNACFLKKMEGKYVWASKCGFNVCCFGYHFTRPSSTNLPGYSDSLLLDRVNCYC